MDSGEGGHRLAREAVRSLVVTFAVWWLAYGRLTPWPSLWYALPRERHLLWFVVAAAGVTGAAVVAVVRAGGARPTRTAGDLGVVAWLILSVWSTRRGDHSGLWALIVPIYLAMGAVMLGAVELAGVAASRRAATGA